MQRLLGNILVLAPSGSLLAFKVELLFLANDLLPWVLWRVGPESALGAQNVIPQEGGSVLLTNPGAMIRWLLLLWGIAAGLILASLPLLWFWWRSRPR